MRFTFSVSNTIPFSLGATLGVGKQLAIKLLATCKAIQREAKTLLYSSCTFRIDIYDAAREAEEPTLLSEAARAESERVSTIWEKEAKPGLLNALDAISPKTLALVNSFVFAYHRYETLEAHQVDHPELSDHPYASIHLQFTGQPPYWRLSVWFSGVRHDCDVAHCESRTCSAVLPYLRATLKGRSLRALSKSDIRDLSRQMTVALATSKKKPLSYTQLARFEELRDAQRAFIAPFFEAR